jgi:hypothetical protein
MGLGGYYQCRECYARRDRMTAPQKLKDGDRVIDRFEVVYECGSRMIIHRDKCNWKMVGFEKKCTPTGG